MNTISPHLFPFQVEGVHFLESNPYAFLADQPGLGKTPQAISAARNVCGVNNDAYRNICVISPKAAKINWRREFRRWWPGFPANNVHIFHYEQLIEVNDRSNEFNRKTWDIMIADEAHRLKTPGAKRTKAVYHKAIRNRQQNPDFRMWLLSGTPAKNHAGEMWTHLAALRPDLITDRSGRVMTQEQFEERFCKVGFDEHGNRRIRGSKNRQEFRQLLMDGGFLLRRLKKDVQQYLPDLIFDYYPLPVQSAVPAGTPYLGGLKGQDLLDFLKSNNRTFAEWQHNVAKVKIPMVKEFVENELDVPGEKMILFFHHTALGRELHHLLGAYQPVIVDGKTKVAQEEVDKFQNDPNCRLLIGQIQTCQEALNITAATQVAFAEASWSPSDNFQAACRAHRHGLEGNLVVRFLSLAGTADEIIARVLAQKSAELSEIFD